MMSEENKKQLVCPLCGGKEFDDEEGKLDSKYGVTAHKVKMKICTNCKYVMLFSLGNTPFDFD